MNDPLKGYRYTPFSPDYNKRVYTNWHGGPFPYTERFKGWKWK